MTLMIEGMMNKVIANELDVSLRTVEMRRHHVFKKTGTRHIAELVKLVIDAQEDATT